MIGLITRRFAQADLSASLDAKAPKPAQQSGLSAGLLASSSSSSLGSSNASLDPSRVVPVMGSDSDTQTVGSIDSVETVCDSFSSHEMTSNIYNEEQNLENLGKIQAALFTVSKIEDQNKRKQLTAEILSKAYVYSRPDLYSKILLPVGDGENNLVAYRFIPVDIQNGMPLFLLTATEDPDKHPPFLVFKGSSPNNFSSIYNDLSVSAVLHGIGTPAFNQSKNAIQTILGALYAANPNNKPILCGHSLGGSLAQLTAVHFPALVQEVYAFNSPKVSKETANKWFTIPFESRPKIFVFNTKGDVVSEKGGSEKIGTHYVVTPTGDEVPKTLRDIHGKTVLNAPYTGVIEEFNEQIIPTGFFGTSAYYAKEFLSLVATVIKVSFSFFLIEPAYLISQWRTQKESKSMPIKDQQLDVASKTADKQYEEKTGQKYWLDGYLDEIAHTPGIISPLYDLDILNEQLIAHAKLWWEVQMTPDLVILKRSFIVKENLAKAPADAVFFHCRKFGGMGPKGQLFGKLLQDNDSSREGLVKILNMLPKQARDQAFADALKHLEGVNGSDLEKRELQILQVLASVPVSN